MENASTGLLADNREGIAHTVPLTADAFCQTYAGRVYKFARLVSSDSADAEDLAQDALERAIRGSTRSIQPGAKSRAGCGASVRSIRMFAAVVTGMVLLTVLAAPSAAASEVKTFTGMKICRAPFVTIAPGSPGGYCLITKASIKILVGAKAYYLDPHIVAGVMNGPIRIVATDERRSTITGHCTYYSPPAVNPWHGLCVYSGGTGRFEGFHARWVIGSPTPKGVTVIGPYWFDREHGDGGGDD